MSTDSVALRTMENMKVGTTSIRGYRGFSVKNNMVNKKQSIHSFMFRACLSFLESHNLHPFRAYGANMLKINFFDTNKL